MNPLVSILMTAYNRELYIAAAIESVLASSYQNFELIIVDDVSKDNTVKIAEVYAVKDERIRLYVNERNLGDYPNRNKAASYASGEYIMYCDSDDLLLIDGIRDCVNAMLLHPETPFGMYWPYSKEEPFVLSPEKAIRQHFFESPFLLIGPGGTIIKRSFFEEIKGYPEKYGPANDGYFNLKCPSLAPIVMLPFEFVYYRRHEGQEINNSTNYIANNYLYLKDALAELQLGLTPAERTWLANKNKRRFLVNILQFLFKTGDWKKTREFIRRTGYGYKEALRAVFH